MLDTKAIFDQLQDLVSRLTSTDAERSVRTLGDMVKGLQQQLAQSKDLEARVDKVMKSVAAAGENFKKQEAAAKKNIDTIEARRKKSADEWEKKIKILSKSSYNIDDMLKLEAKRDKSMDRYAGKLKAANVQQSVANSKVKANAAQYAGLVKQSGLHANNTKLITANLTRAVGQHQAARQHVAAQNQLMAQMASVLGVNVGQVRNLAIMFQNIGTTGIGLIIEGLKIATKTYQEFRAVGQSATQSLENIPAAFSAMWEGLRQGVVAFPYTFAKSLANLQTQLGRMDVPKELAVEAARLSEQYKVSVEESTKLVGALARVNGLQGKITQQEVQQVATQARFQGMSPGAVFSDIAKNTQYFAQYANQGFVAFGKTVMELKKMGVEMSSVEGLADSMVDDFEGSLKMQSQLATVLPGLNLQGVQFASQFGTDAQVAEQLKSAVLATGMTSLSQLPRSTRNLLKKLLPADQFENLIKSTGTDLKGGKPDVLDETTTGYINTIENLVKPALIGLATAASLAATSLGLQAAGMTGAGGIMRAGAMGLTTAIGGIAGAVTLLWGATSLAQQMITATNAAPNGQKMSAIGGVAGDNKFGIGGAILGLVAGGLAAFFSGGTAIPIIAAALAGGGAGMLGGSMFDKKKSPSTSILDPVQAKYDEQSKKNIAWMTGEKHHTGGIVGAGPSIQIPKFHSGFMPGEVPAILQKGEAVLSKTQLGGLTQFMNVTKDFGKLGDAFKNFDMSSITSGISSISSLFKGGSSSSGSSGGLLGMIGSLFGGSSSKGSSSSSLLGTLGGLISGKTSLTSALGSLFGGGSSSSGSSSSGGLLGTLGGLISGKTSLTSALGSLFGGSSSSSSSSSSGGLLGTLGDLISGKTSLTSAIGSLFGGSSSSSSSSGGLLNTIGGLFSGKTSLTSAIGSLFGGKAGSTASTISNVVSGKTSITDAIGSLFGGSSSSTSGSTSLLSKIPGVSTLLNKIPGLDVVGSVIGQKGKLGNNIAGALAGKAIGGVIGSIIPGVGTVLGTVVGSFAGKQVSNFLNNTKAGKAISGAYSKVYGGLGHAIGGVARGIGHVFGGLFGHKHKAAPPVTPPLMTPEMTTAAVSAAGIDPSATPVTSTPAPTVTIDMKPLEAQMATLINLMQNGGIAVNIDGKKVGGGVLDAFSRG